MDHSSLHIPVHTPFHEWSESNSKQFETRMGQGQSMLAHEVQAEAGVHGILAIDLALLPLVELKQVWVLRKQIENNF